MCILEDRTPPMHTFGQNGEERIAKILNEATRGLNAHGLSPLGPHKDMASPNTASSLALPISQVHITYHILSKEDSFFYNNISLEILTTYK